MNETKYTQEEIKGKINILNTEIELLKSKRTEISQTINSKKKQVVKWEEFDISQYKLL